MLHVLGPYPSEMEMVFFGTVVLAEVLTIAVLVWSERRAFVDALRTFADDCFPEEDGDGDAPYETPDDDRVRADRARLYVAVRLGSPVSPVRDLRDGVTGMGDYAAAVVETRSARPSHVGVAGTGWRAK